MQPGFRTHEELKDYISSTKSQILGSWEYRRILDVRYILQRLTIRGSISFLRQKARAQKARKLGLSGLSASFLYMNFGFKIERNSIDNVLSIFTSICGLPLVSVVHLFPCLSDFVYRFVRVLYTAFGFHNRGDEPDSTDKNDHR